MDILSDLLGLLDDVQFRLKFLSVLDEFDEVERVKEEVYQRCVVVCWDVVVCDGDNVLGFANTVSPGTFPIVQRAGRQLS